MSTAADPGLTRGEQFREVLVFLFLILPSMALSFLVVQQGNLSFRITAASTILRDLGLVALIAFFLWHNAEPAARIGWTFRFKWQDAALGIVLFIPMSLATSALDAVLRSIGFTSPATTTPRFLTLTTPGDYVLAVVLVIVVAIAEEVIFRGYLILRLNSVTGNIAAAVLLSSALFSLGHGYEGTAGVVTVGFMGLFFAVVYLWRGSLVAPMVMHFIQDFLGIVVLPLVKHHS